MESSGPSSGPSSGASSSDEEARGSPGPQVHLLHPPSPSRRCSVSRVKVWTTRTAIAAFFLVGGIEYSVVLPTLWDFLRGKGGEEWLYGLTLAAFSISNLFTGPLYGVVFDMTHQTKLIVLVANLFEIGGNFMYFAATSKYMIVGSRFIVGLGAGAGATLFGELARVSTRRERTKIFSLYSSFRQIGLILGPAFNLVLRLLNVKMGPFILDNLTSPGALMTVMWLVIEIMFLFMFFKLPDAVEPVVVQDTSEEAEPQINNGSSRTVTGDKVEKELRVSSERKYKKKKNLTKSGPEFYSERAPLLVNPQKINKYSVNRTELTASETSSVSVSETRVVCDGGRMGKARRYAGFVLSRMVREEIVVLLAVTFLTLFSQTVIETMLVPMAESLLNWTETDTSIFYSCAGVELIVGIILVYILSVWIGDRWIMLGGLLLGVVGYAWLLGFIGPGNKEIKYVDLKFVLGTVVMVFSLPFILVAAASLYSKLLPMQVQGIGQGFRRSVFSIASILGPLWSGGALAFPNYYILISVPLALLVMVTILVVLSFARLREPKTKGKRLRLP